MRILVVLSEEAAKFKGSLKSIGTSVEVLEVKDLLFLSPSDLRQLLPAGFESIYDYVILPGSYPWDAGLVGPNVFKGPEGLGLLARLLMEGGRLQLSKQEALEKYVPSKVSSLARRDLEAVNSSPELLPATPPPMRVLAEIPLSGAESPGELLDKARSLVADGADIVVLAPLTDKARAKLKEYSSRLSDTGIALGLDADYEVLASSPSGFRVLLSLRPWQAKDVSWAKGRYVVVLSEDTAAAAEYAVHIASQGVRPVLDPVMKPPVVPGVWDSMNRLSALRYYGFPKMVGVSNVVELMDADTSGSAAMLVFIAAELGASSLLVEEASTKARGLTAEVRRAADMASLSLLWLKPPKDVGVSLLNSKVKLPELASNGYSVRLTSRDSVEVSLGSRRVTVSCRDRCPPKELGFTDPSLIIMMYRACLPWSAGWSC
ncbi:MAG: hypothetical protein RXR70_04590 [Acidilobus sp.]